MSNIDKRALREAAERALADNHTQDEWFHYLRCSSPETVLALLDELEAMHKYAKDRDAENEGLMITVGRLRVEKEAAEKLIAELEAREVKLPELCVGVVQGGHAVMVPYAAGHWFNKTAILEMLSDAGINIAAAGKGEAS
ncbi:ead/Ea22-like family protein [Enterobacter hormaechei]|uniref:ead/Ea22-like family protein n=1 Tax=Enterobacter hormaechei TaxID=158836 RepID=UPI00337D89E9|nr:ead/Ea22-like family protein [Enterobacter hormaechei subsp. xiangfangensis]HCM9384168.1 ead/Ea22-like family protein [Enterobacter hormaechei subsp. xiangfangensis]HCM9694245.1 ead/Ea22-like family protein [Enterobacter hormaechei subsp. xiangfangensis]